MEQTVNDTYMAILKRELVPALGCTEPISIAYAAARARQVLGVMPQRLLVECSGNIIKNVKGVVVPGTGDMRGVDVSAVLGALAGDPQGGLEVLAPVTQKDAAETARLLEQDVCGIRLLEGEEALRIIVHAFAGDDEAVVEIAGGHMDVVRVERNARIVERDEQDAPGEEAPDYGLLNLRDIWDFSQRCDIQAVSEILERQIAYNTRIAREGLERSYGSAVGRCLLRHGGQGVAVMAKALPAAGSDARMGGCELPVVINSGSGNQGLTVSLPVIAYAEELEVSRELLLRALCLSNLIAIHLKAGIGKLSAYCGVVSAACGSGAAITYLHGGDYEAICRTVTNMLGDVSGIVCDGAKSSCAAKIASAVDAAIMSHCLAMDGKAYRPGEGLTADEVEKTIRNISRLGREGMRSTDVEILNMMIGR